VSRSAALLKFFRTPKGLLTIVLVALSAIAAPGEHWRPTLLGIIVAVVTAGVLDAIWLRLRRPRWQFPGGAVLTGLIVAMVLSPFEPLWVPAAVSAIAIASKYVVRTKAANVFNPAGIALVISYYAFDTGQSWWGALPELSPWAIGILLATGLFITDRVNKMPLVLAFLATYFTAFTVTTWWGDPQVLVEIYRAPDVHAVLYFAFFMLTDPPTAPITYRDQLICGVLVALVSYLLFETLGVVYYLLAGLIVGNLWEARRRATHTRRKHDLRHRAAGRSDRVGVLP
jgi:Na+-translocating ferredoxin:NAD+ oxidoreductase RnfD subunit